jgi:hypothetical protein
VLLIAKVERIDVMGQENRCQLHDKELKRATVGVSYGLPYQDDPYFEARRTLFPNSNLSVSGGCCAGSMGYKTEAFVCEECRMIEEQWQEKNNPLYKFRLIPE